MKLLKYLVIILYLINYKNLSLAKDPSALINEIVDEAALVLSSDDPVESKIIKGRIRKINFRNKIERWKSWVKDRLSQKYPTFFPEQTQNIFETERKLITQGDLDKNYESMNNEKGKPIVIKTCRVTLQFNKWEDDYINFLKMIMDAPP